MPKSVIKLGGNGTLTYWTASAGTKWEAVQLEGGAYIYHNTAAQSYSATLLAADLAGVPAGAKIKAVGIRFRGKDGGGSLTMRAGLYLGGSSSYGTTRTMTASYVYYPSSDYETVARPGGGSWVRTDLNTLEPLVQPVSGGGFVYCDIFDIEVEWDAGGWNMQISM